ncbi:hypothetical protein HPP92_009907 [Vanilla planifolia]|uniref:Uncharacterized protein n=1 Tax=Vanilla planifolia TaxID=51239 RepID=A0A835V5W6_VANPL|nr:hypothetical protein HPP92_009907 [Vanilla planifolia]
MKPQNPFPTSTAAPNAAPKLSLKIFLLQQPRSASATSFSSPNFHNCFSNYSHLLFQYGQLAVEIDPKLFLSTPAHTVSKPRSCMSSDINTKRNDHVVEVAERYIGGVEMEPVELVEPNPRARCAEDEEMGGSSSYQAYPKALASSEDVLSNKTLFMETLEKLHVHMGTKFLIPVVGRETLDLHRLYVEVICRGGIEKVIMDRRWKEVVDVLNLPASVTNASFVLRKHYISLLYHYEKIYFFGAKGWNVTSAVSPSSLSRTKSESVSKASSSLPFSGMHSYSNRKRKGNKEMFATGLPLLPNQVVAGVIDGSFDDGYFITVMAGTTKLKGVLYHMSPQNAPPEQQAPSSRIANNSSLMYRHRRRRRRKLSTLDPTHPKPNRSGYNFFFAEERARLKALYPEKDRELSKMIGDLWNRLNEAERSVYQERALQDKERYQSEMALYRERRKSVAVLPIQQRSAEPSTETRALEDGRSNLLSMEKQ